LLLIVQLEHGGFIAARAPGCKPVD
jgi:hypothetical protein